MLSDSQGIVVISPLLTTAQLLTNGVFHDEGMLGFETRMIVVLKIVDPQKYGFQYKNALMTWMIWGTPISRKLPYIYIHINITYIYIYSLSILMVNPSICRPFVLTTNKISSHPEEEEFRMIQGFLASHSFKDVNQPKYGLFGFRLGSGVIQFFFVLTLW
jgi:hypothetical protein